MFTGALIVALICTFSVAAVTHISAQRRDREILRIVKCIDAMLKTWADNWGEPTTEVRVKLLEIVKACGDQRKGERRRLNV